MSASPDQHTLSRRSFTRLGLIALGTCTLSLAGLSGCADKSAASSDGPAEATDFVFDTVIQIKGYCSQDLVDSAKDRCEYFDSIFSRTREGSDIWNINHAGGAPTTVAPETADIIAKALPYCELSGGLFDITIGAASSLWNFDDGVVADPDELAEAIKHIDYRGVSVDGDTVTLADPQAMLDLGGIAKGYIADDIASLLTEGGCESAFINLGGNVYALGHKPDGNEWNVGIQDPNEAEGVVIASTYAASQSVVTSGLYEREFTVDGVTYYHILDPKTGYPVVTDLESSSIVSDKSIDGDAYSTILFLNGKDKALQIVEDTPQIEAILIDDSGQVTQSSGIEITLY